MFLTRSAFSGCFSNTSRNPGSCPVSKTPFTASFRSIPSCQKTSTRLVSIGEASDGDRLGTSEAIGGVNGLGRTRVL